ncbi:MAG: hypothetical protein LWW93_03760 [Hyphomicrobiales bacterium]|nr:hypothetical protein [Hyphomicrobiales bacterium]
MITLSRLLLRFLVAGAGLSAAIVAGLAIGVAASVHDATATGDGDIYAIFDLTVRGGALLPLFAGIVWPAWVVAVVLGEITATRSLLVHLLVATAISVVGVMGGAAFLGVERLESTAAIGLTAGFVHWLVAGRGAGLTAPPRLAGAPRPLHDAPAKNPISEEDRMP